MIEKLMAKYKEDLKKSIGKEIYVTTSLEGVFDRTVMLNDNFKFSGKIINVTDSVFSPYLVEINNGKFITKLNDIDFIVGKHSIDIEKHLKYVIAFKINRVSSKDDIINKKRIPRTIHYFIESNELEDNIVSHKEIFEYKDLFFDTKEAAEKYLKSNDFDFLLKYIKNKDNIFIESFYIK